MQLHLECSLQVLSADNDVLTCDVEVCLCWLLPETEKMNSFQSVSFAECQVSLHSQKHLPCELRLRAKWLQTNPHLYLLSET